MTKQEVHLDIYVDRSELHDSGKKSVFHEGTQSIGASERFATISNAFADGFYEKILSDPEMGDELDMLEEEQAALIKSLVGEITSEVGRAVVGLTCLQLAIKAICPEQSVRLHKGNHNKGSFSWKEGLSMRVLDKKYNTPFLRKHNLLKLNKDGVMMTRSLAENYPYTRLYKAEIRGPINEWKTIVEQIEDGTLSPKGALYLLISLLKNHSDQFSMNVSTAISLANKCNKDFEAISSILVNFFNATTYSSRAFEVVIHGFMQAFNEMGLIEGDLVPLSQMRSANKKHGNIGDIEVKVGDYIVESWDAKYGKSNLRDELEELADKLATHQGVDLAGFITSGPLEMTDDIDKRADELSQIHDCEISLLSFRDWLAQKISLVPAEERNIFGKKWLVAVVESFGQRRTDIAPIDEPCDQWIDDLSTLLGLED